jgi:predicted metalloprotease with PDZ domain
MKGTLRTDRIAVWLITAVVLLSASFAVQAGPRTNETIKSTSFIGVVMQVLDENIVKGLDLNTKYGVLVAEVVEDSPAEKAGIEDGDVIIEFDGMKVKNPDDLKKMVLKARVGEKVKVKLIRDHDSKVLALVVGEQPEHTELTFESPEHKEFIFKIPGDIKQIHKNVLSYFDPSRKLGVRVSDLDDDLGSYFDTEAGEGVLVLGIEDDSVAEEMGIKAGDVILSIDGDGIDSIDELKSEVKDIETDNKFDVVVLRHGKKITLTGMFEDESEEAVRTFKWQAMKSDKDLPMKYDVQTFKFDKDEMQQLREEMKQLQIEMKKMKKQLKKELKDLDED